MKCEAINETYDLPQAGMMQVLLDSQQQLAARDNVSSHVGSIAQDSSTSGEGSTKQHKRLNNTVNRKLSNNPNVLHQKYTNIILLST